MNANQFMVLQTCVSVFMATITWGDFLASSGTEFEDDMRASCVGRPPSESAILAYRVSTLWHLWLYFFDPIASQKRSALPSSPMILGALAALAHFAGIPACIVAFAALAVVDLVRMENRSELRLMMRLHHIITLALLSLSWVTGLTTFGMQLLFIHDFTDIFMFLLRIARKFDGPFFVYVVLAASVIVTWAVLRVTTLASVNWTCFACAECYCSGHTATYQLVVVSECSLIAVLLAFNAYWTGLVIYKSVRELTGVKTDRDNE